MNNIISIVTPSLNQGKYIEQTINSVLSQVGDFFIDYIIIDGGSTDESIEIIKKYDNDLKMGKYSVKCAGIEFRWLSESDSGQANALNKGFKMAKGDICAWINSDDYYEYEAFEFVMSKFKESPDVDLIYGNCYEILESGEMRSGEVIKGDFTKNIEEGCLISQPAAFFTKMALSSVGYIDELFNYCMDFDLWLKILKQGKCLCFSRHLAYFRIWENSKTKLYQKKFREEENNIRKKYGGSVINPGAIHRIRYKIPFVKFIKKRFPLSYGFIKNCLYFTINKIRY